jgi:hypothetical protein
MLGKPPSLEKNKEILDQELVDALRSKGVENPEALMLLQRWLENPAEHIPHLKDSK